MAKLTAFMYANEARNDIMPNGQAVQSVINPLLSLKPAFIPGQLSFAVIFGITDFDFNKEHTFQYRLLDPDGNIVIDTGIVPMPTNPNEDERAKMDGFIGNFDIRNAIFRKEGLYKNEILFDGVKLKDDYISVKGADIDGNGNKV